MPFQGIRWRLAAWNLLVLALVLGVTLGVAALGEVRAHERALEGELTVVATRIATRLQRQARERLERLGGGEAREHERSDHERGEHEHEHGEDDGHARGEREHDEDERGEHARDEHARAPRRATGGEPAGPEPADLPTTAARADLPTTGVPADVVVLVAWPGAPLASNRSPLPRGLPDAPALAAALRGESVGSEATVAGEPLRLLTVPVTLDGHVVAAVQVGKPTREDREALARSLLVLLVTGLAGLVVSLAGSVFLAARAMRPIGEAFDRQRRFLADASHELRTPVAVLRARAELLERDADALPSSARDEVRRLRGDADELAALLDELLDLTRLDAGTTVLVLEPVAVADVVEDLGAQLAPLAEARSVELRAVTTPVWARAQTTRVRQVLRALADNALKHTPAGGHVRIELDRADAWARVRITDDGEGIAAEHLPRVFDRFYRADDARSREDGASRGGAGLGLAIAAQLVRLMHGELQLDSGSGRGTVATVLLPLASPPA